MSKEQIAFVRPTEATLKESFTAVVRAGNLPFFMNLREELARLSPASIYELAVCAAETKHWEFFEFFLSREGVEWATVPPRGKSALIVLAAREKQWDIVQKIWPHYLQVGIGLGKDVGIDLSKRWELPELLNLVVQSGNQCLSVEELLNAKVSISLNCLSLTDCPETAGLLLKFGAPFTTTNPNPLQTALSKGQWRLAEILAQSCTVKDPLFLWREMRSAIRARQYGVVDALLKNNRKFCNARHLREYLEIVFDLKDPAMLAILLKHDLLTTDYTFTCQAHTESIMQRAIRMGACALLTECVLSSSASSILAVGASAGIFKRDVKDVLSLMIRLNRQDLVWEYAQVSHGQDAIREYALEPVIRGDNLSMLHLLCFLGADPNKNGWSRKSALALLVEMGNNLDTSAAVSYMTKPHASLPQFFVDYLAAVYLYCFSATTSFSLISIISRYVFGDFVSDFVFESEKNLKQDSELEQKQELEPEPEPEPEPESERKIAQARIQVAAKGRGLFDTQEMERQFFAECAREKMGSDRENPLFGEAKLKEYQEKLEHCLEEHDKSLSAERGKVFDDHSLVLEAFIAQLRVLLSKSKRTAVVEEGLRPELTVEESGEIEERKGSGIAAVEQEESGEVEERKMPTVLPEAIVAVQEGAQSDNDKVEEYKREVHNYMDSFAGQSEEEFIAGLEALTFKFRAAAAAEKEQVAAVALQEPTTVMSVEEERKRISSDQVEEHPIIESVKKIESRYRLFTDNEEHLKGKLAEFSLLRARFDSGQSAFQRFKYLKQSAEQLMGDYIKANANQVAPCPFVARLASVSLLPNARDALNAIAHNPTFDVDAKIIKLLKEFPGDVDALIGVNRLLQDAQKLEDEALAVVLHISPIVKKDESFFFSRLKLQPKLSEIKVSFQGLVDNLQSPHVYPVVAAGLSH